MAKKSNNFSASGILEKSDSSLFLIVNKDLNPDKGENNIMRIAIEFDNEKSQRTLLAPFDGEKLLTISGDLLSLGQIPRVRANFVTRYDACLRPMLGDSADFSGFVVINKIIPPPAAESGSSALRYARIGVTTETSATLNLVALRNNVDLLENPESLIRQKVRITASLQKTPGNNPYLCLKSITPASSRNMDSRLCTGMNQVQLLAR